MKIFYHTAHRQSDGHLGQRVPGVEDIILQLRTCSKMSPPKHFFITLGLHTCFT